MMSIFSPRSSETTMRTREPRGPTQAPTGSTPAACDSTAIFERYPGSRATPRISTRPSAISGTSSSKSVLISSGSRRGRMTRGPFVPLRTSGVHEHVVAVAGLLDDAGHDLADAVDVLLVHHLALGLADPLQDDLLRRLRGDAAEVLGRDVLALHLLL